MAVSDLPYCFVFLTRPSVCFCVCPWVQLHEEVRKSLEQCDIQEDIEHFVNLRRTGDKPPGTVPHSSQIAFVIQRKQQAHTIHYRSSKGYNENQTFFVSSLMLLCRH